MWHVLRGSSDAAPARPPSITEAPAKAVSPTRDGGAAAGDIPGIPAAPAAARSSGAPAEDTTAGRAPVVDLVSPTAAAPADSPVSAAARIVSGSAEAEAATAAPAAAGSGASPAPDTQAGAARGDDAGAAADVDRLLEKAMAEFSAGAAGAGGASEGAAPPLEQQPAPATIPAAEYRASEPTGAAPKPEAGYDSGLRAFAAQLESVYTAHSAQLKVAETEAKMTAAEHRAAAMSALRRFQKTVQSMGRVLADLQAGMELQPSEDVLYKPEPAEAPAPAVDVAAVSDALPGAVVPAEGESDQDTPKVEAAAQLSPTLPRPQLVQWPEPEEGGEAAGAAAFTSAVGDTFATPDDLAPLAAAARRTPLHYEMLEFMRHTTPSEAALDDVGRVLDAINEAVAPVLGGGHAVLFGSLPAGLALLESDIDVVLVEDTPTTPLPSTSGFSQSDRAAVAAQLGKVMRALEAAGLLAPASAKLLGMARVPLLKTELAVPGSGGRRRVAADICLGVTHGPRAVAFARDQVKQLAPLRPLLLLLKAFLKQQGLNVVHRGGLSSFSLLNMVIAHLQEERLAQPLQPEEHHDIEYDVRKQLEFARSLAAAATVPVEDMPDTPGIDLGALATSFLHRFGHTFDYSERAVSVRSGGVVPADTIGAAAHARGPSGAGKGPRIAIEDPQEPGLIIGASSYNIAAVAAAFGRASLALADAMVQWNTCALDPVSDAWLRDAAAADAEATEAHLPPPERRRRLLSFGELPPPALTLMLGRVLSLDCAIGGHTLPYTMIREALAQHGHIHI